MPTGKIFYFTLLMMMIQSCVSQIPAKYNGYLVNSTQAILVTASGIQSNGELIFYERETVKDKWKKQFSFPVQIGRNGFATDIVFDTTATITKQEGDGCSPAGVFTLGPVFSYHAMENLNMPFQQVNKNNLCVDDVQSEYYNRLINTDTISNQDWNSFEFMQRNDLQYEYGIWVNYNAEIIISGNGSCIFLHVWKDENSPTSGCTAMQKENLLRLIYALDEKRNPVLIQERIDK
ncbi:MAG: L,D-transpeptidase family protein [Chitinophagales bacterium]